MSIRAEELQLHRGDERLELAVLTVLETAIGCSPADLVSNSGPGDRYQLHRGDERPELAVLTVLGTAIGCSPAESVSNSGPEDRYRNAWLCRAGYARQLTFSSIA
jgi:hypothetical protein